MSKDDKTADETVSSAPPKPAAAAPAAKPAAIPAKAAESAPVPHKGGPQLLQLLHTAGAHDKDAFVRAEPDTADALIAAKQARRVSLEDVGGAEIAVFQEA